MIHKQPSHSLDSLHMDCLLSAIEAQGSSNNYPLTRVLLDPRKGLVLLIGLGWCSFRNIDPAFLLCSNTCWGTWEWSRHRFIILLCYRLLPLVFTCDACFPLLVAINALHIRTLVWCWSGYLSSFLLLLGSLPALLANILIVLFLGTPFLFVCIV